MTSPVTETARFTCRIVMLTDDVQIDRRILLQAKTLMRHGAEVILLAQGGEGLKDYETLPGGIKLRRYYAPNSVPGMGGWAMQKQQGFVNRLNRRSVRLQGELNQNYGWLDSRIAAHVANKRYLKAFVWQRVQKATLAWHGFRIKNSVQRPAVLSLRLAQLGLRIFNRVDGPRALDLHLASMAAYYRPDVVQAHDLPQLPAAVEVKKMIGSAVVYDAHELYPEIGSLTTKQRQVAARRERKYIHSADRTSTINPYIAAEIAARYKCDPPDLIFNATERPEGFQTGVHDDRIRAATGLGKDVKILLFQGWVHEMRGICDLVRSMAQVREDVHLVLLGYGQMDLMAATATESGVRDRLHILPAVPWDELLHWTAAADAGIIPYQKSDLNNYLCSPNKLFEFILAGLPIIGSDFPFLKDVIRGNGFGVTGDLETIEGFAKAINEMFDDDGRAVAEMKRNLLAKADDWSWAAQEETLLRIFSEAGAQLRVNESPEPVVADPRKLD
jgi:glycosyltransferase involved in cell wall biosynthesis